MIVRPPRRARDPVPAPLFGRGSKSRIPTSAGPLLLSEDDMANALMHLAGMVVYALSVMTITFSIYAWGM